MLENHRLQGRVRSSYLAVVGMLADAVESQDPFVESHSTEVSNYIERVARRLGLDAATREQVVFTGLLRDGGREAGDQRAGAAEAGPPHPGRAEGHRAAPGHRRTHRGARPRAGRAVRGIRHHHERWDGHGYPDGLAVGEEIPVEARLVAVADSFGALISSRPYREQVAPAEACAEIERCSGSQFDPAIAALFVEEVRRQPPDAGSGERRLATVPAEEVLAAARLGAASAAASDNVTLLHSHRHLQEVAAREAKRAGRSHQPFAVAILELSELATINRREGYAAGDMALQTAARALERAVAGEQSTVGRYSGRRLAVVLPRTGHSAAEHEARLEEELKRCGTRVRVGVGLWEEGDCGEDVFARARLALEATPTAT